MFNPLMPNLNTHGDMQKSRYVYGMFGVTINYVLNIQQQRANW